MADAPKMKNVKLVRNPSNQRQVLASWTKPSKKMTEIKEGKKVKKGKKEHKIETVKEYNAIWSYKIVVTGKSTKTVSEDKITINYNTTVVSHDIPDGCTAISFKIKPVSKKYTKDKKKNEKAYWTTSSYTNASPNPLELSAVSITPSAPTVSLDNKGKLKIEANNLENGNKAVQFRYAKDNSAITEYNGEISISTNYASWEPTVEKGHTYKASVRIRIIGKQWSEWSPWSSETGAIPIAPTSLTLRAASTNQVDLSWNAVAGATGYDINYVTSLENFDLTEGTTVSQNNGTTSIRLTLERGFTYYFRVRATNSNYQSTWFPATKDKASAKYITLGLKPAAPTTFSLVSVVEYGGTGRLYWIHNALDGSTQKSAKIWFRVKHTIHSAIHEGYVIVPNPKYDDEIHKDDNLYYDFDTSSADGLVLTTPEGSGLTIYWPYIDSFDWRVATCGITNEYGDWSVYRTIDIRVKPTLHIYSSMDGVTWNSPSTVTSLPLYLKMSTTPTSQTPIGYSIIVTANETYNYEDIFGDPARIVKGQTVYSTYLSSDESDEYYTLLPSMMDFENDIEYKLTVMVATDQGLSDEDSLIFTPDLDTVAMHADADIEIDEDRLIAHIIPSCHDQDFDIEEYMDEEGYADPDDLIGELVEDVVLSVYRKNPDGSFTEIDSNIPNTGATIVTDPHPTLGSVTYRIVAMSSETGQMSYTDVESEEYEQPGIVLNWNETISRGVANDEGISEFDEEYVDGPMYTGSMLKLPYNVTVTENRNPDVELVEYIGRSRPVSYYGTQQGESYSLTTVLPKETFDDDLADPKSLDILRTIASNLRPVYLRESVTRLGCWCHITTSITSNYNDELINISINANPIDSEDTYFDARLAMLNVAKKAEAELPDSIDLSYIDGL